MNAIPSIDYTRGSDGDATSAQLLYDLGTESTPLPLAQAALLMMGWVPPSDMGLNPYRTWLGLAIQHARSINADRYAEPAEPNVLTSPSERNHRNALRRLWWCCVILDRISPLCTRFRLFITHDLFDFKNAVPLGMADLEAEIHRSSVFTAATKRCQLALFSRFLELIILLTGVLTLIFPFEDSKWDSQEDGDLDLDKCDAAMKDWYARAILEFPPHGDGYKSQLDGNPEPDKSIVLHTNLMYIYYQ